jgi:primase-polymerase (primpol)-like protein
LSRLQTSIPHFRVPDDLTERDQWVLWRYESRKDKPTKIPYQVSGKPADSTNPGTWATFGDALGAWRGNRQRYTGLGFVFSREDPFAGIDLDDSLDEQGDVKAWARGIIERFSDTYVEISPSYQGVKIWLRGSLPANVPGVQVGDGTIELYDHSRYFAVTGRVFCGAPLEIEDHSADLLLLYERLTGGRKRCQPQPLESGRIPYGQQHNTLISLLGTLRARRVCDEAIEACLQAMNAHQCERPGPREHISRMVRSSRTWRTR